MKRIEPVENQVTNTIVYRERSSLSNNLAIALAIAVLSSITILFSVGMIANAIKPARQSPFIDASTNQCL